MLFSAQVPQSSSHIATPKHDRIANRLNHLLAGKSDNRVIEYFIFKLSGKISDKDSEDVIDSIIKKNFNQIKDEFKRDGEAYVRSLDNIFTKEEMGRVLSRETILERLYQNRIIDKQSYHKFLDDCSKSPGDH